MGTSATARNSRIPNTFFTPFQEKGPEKTVARLGSVRILVDRIERIDKADKGMASLGARKGSVKLCVPEHSTCSEVGTGRKRHVAPQSTLLTTVKRQNPPVKRNKNVSLRIRTRWCRHQCLTRAPTYNNNYYLSHESPNLKMKETRTST